MSTLVQRFGLLHRFLIHWFLVFSAIISAIVMRPTDSGRVLRPGHREAGEIHMRRDTGTPRAHFTHHTNLMIQSKKYGKTCFLKNIYISTSVIRGEVIHMSVHGNHSAVVDTAVISNQKNIFLEYIFLMTHMILTWRGPRPRLPSSC